MNSETTLFFKIKNCLAVVLISFFIINAFLTQTAYGNKDYGLERIRSCDAKTGSVEGFDASEFGKKESQFDLGNSSCLGWAIGTYGVVKSSIAIMNGACKSGSPIPRVIPSPFQDAADIFRAGTKAKDSSCRSAILTAEASYQMTMEAFLILLGTAKSYYESVSLCGDEWFKPNPETLLIDDAYNGGDENLKSESRKRRDQVVQWLENGETQKMRLENPNDPNDKDAKTYREFYYGGIEVVSDHCIDPATKKPQLYYFRGTNQANYRCEIYNPIYHEEKKSEYQEAYDCCLNISQNYVCLSKNKLRIAGQPIHTFCKAGGTCLIDGVAKFEAYFLDNQRLICTRSYSLCPYNFSVSGGTTYADYYADGINSNGSYSAFDPDNPQHKTTDSQTGKISCQTSKSEIRNEDCSFNNKVGKLKNYCQFYRHCMIVSEKKYFPNFSDMNPYFSRACLDFKGDSKNGFSYNGIPQLGKTTNFSAPIAQCFKETLENVFFNRYGHSICADGNISITDKCETSYLDANGNVNIIENYLLTAPNKPYKVGEMVRDQSFFSKIQQQMRQIVKMLLSFAITMFGVGILLGKIQLKVKNKKDILLFMLKFAAVVYFALGNAWQDGFFNGVYGMSTKLSETLFKVRLDFQTFAPSKTDSQDNVTEILKLDKTDGCQFGVVYTQEGSAIATTPPYPKGKEYLMIFDTLDCKLMKFLGYGPSSSASSVATLIIAFFFTGAIGIYFAMSILIFAMMFIALMIRAIQLFISVGIAIIIYVFVSPLILPLMLFERTKSIFDAWFTQLIGFCFQPIILFAYLGIFITLVEGAMLGSASYSKPDPYSYSKEINCEKYCINQVTLERTTCEDQNNSNGNKILKTELDPYDDSMACILNFNKFGKNEGFELFGVGLPSVENLLTPGHIEVRMFTVLKCALLIFILAKFMDQIPEITTQLISSALPTSDANSKTMLDKTAKFAAGVQKRLARALKSKTLSAAKEGFGKAKSSADKGEDSAVSDNSGADMTGSSKQTSESGGDMIGRTNQANDMAGAVSGAEAGIAARNSDDNQDAAGRV